jgi:acyl-CoA carboxylase subunit beta
LVSEPVPASAAEAQWTKCPACAAFIYRKRLRRALGVCPECNHHFRLTAKERLAQLIDEDSFIDLGREIEPIDPLGFVDTRPYAERIADAQRKTGATEAMTYGTGTIGGHPVVVAIMDFGFIGGSMGSAVGEAVTRAAEHAVESATPLLVVAASGGARMQEGSISLMQMAKTSQAIARMRAASVLYICILTDPTFGGVTASFATLADVLVAEPGSYIGFAGRRVIEQTIRQQLPDGFQTSEFLMGRGMLDIVQPRETLRPLLRRLLSFYANRGSHERGTTLLDVGGIPPIQHAADLAISEPWDVVQLARRIERPTTLEYIGHVFDDFQELHGDRLFGDDPAIVGGLARLGQLTVVVVGHQKGHSTGELVERNFGMPQPEGYRKALRLMSHAARFGIPIVTMIDTPGAYPGVGAEERGQSIAIAESILAMSRLPVPIISIVTGEGGSGGALALALGDRVLMLENSYLSVISPEGCSVILFRDAAAAPVAAAALKLTAPDLLRLGVVDAAVPEPPGGAHVDPEAAAANLKSAIATSLHELLPLDEEQLLEGRYRRFRRFGTPGEQIQLTTATEGS